MIDRLARDIRARSPRNGEFLLVALDGRGASGKTTLSRLLVKELPGFELVHGDDFWAPSSDSEFGWFDEDRFRAEVIGPLGLGRRDLSYRPHDWATGGPGAERRVAVDAGVLVERCYAAQLPLQWDLTVWVDVPPEVSLARGTARNPAQAKVWAELWRPREDAYIDAYRPHVAADAVVDGTAPFW